MRISEREMALQIHAAWRLAAISVTFVALTIISFVMPEWVQFILLCGAVISGILLGIGVVSILEDRKPY